MKNCLRFLVALLISIVSMVLIFGLIALLFPIALALSITFLGIWIIGAIILGLALIISFIWFISRKEKNLKEGSNSYSISSGNQI